MQRRQVLFSLAALPWMMQGCGGGGVSSVGETEATPSDLNSGGTTYGSKPNVLFISIDDLNDWTGFLAGHPQVQTPNLDALAARASVFERAYCNAPLCNPSRSSALTGLMPHHTQIYNNDDRLREKLPSVTTLPQHFLNNGYNTVSIGKVFHYSDPNSWSQVIAKAADVLPSTTPTTNTFCADQGAESPSGYFDWAALDISDEATADGKAAASAISFLQQSQSKPFFLA
jgi:arylsulfatase A-like enzyme